MAELEAGHPDELGKVLRNFLREAYDPVGSLPSRTDPVEWAVRRFIESWSDPVRGAIDQIEECLEAAAAHLNAGDASSASREIDAASQLVRESLRDDLGLYR